MIVNSTINKIERKVVSTVNVRYGKDGKNAFEVWLETNPEGTREEYQLSIKGEDGYTPVKGVDYFDGEDGENGKSNYQLWLNEGNAGSVQDYLDSQKGSDANVTQENIENAIGADTVITNSLNSNLAFKNKTGSTRVYLIPETNGVQQQSGLTAGLKLFTTNYLNNLVDYADFGIYAAGDGFYLNSKKSGNWTYQVPLKITYQDAFTLAYFDFESKRIGLGDQLVPQENVDILKRFRLSEVLIGDGFTFNTKKNEAGTTIFSISRQSGNHHHINSIAGLKFATGNGNLGTSNVRMFINTTGRVSIGSEVDNGVDILQLAGSLRAQSYRSNDGSEGINTTYPTGDGRTVTVKNGLITNVS